MKTKSPPPPTQTPPSPPLKKMHPTTTAKKVVLFTKAEQRKSNIVAFIPKTSPQTTLYLKSKSEFANDNIINNPLITTIFSHKAVLEIVKTEKFQLLNSELKYDDFKLYKHPPQLVTLTIIRGVLLYENEGIKKRRKRTAQLGPTR